jgi:hypothetical protein
MTGSLPYSWRSEFDLIFHQFEFSPLKSLHQEVSTVLNGLSTVLLSNFNLRYHWMQAFWVTCHQLGGHPKCIQPPGQRVFEVDQKVFTSITSFYLLFFFIVLSNFSLKIKILLNASEKSHMPSSRRSLNSHPTSWSSCLSKSTRRFSHLQYFNSSLISLRLFNFFLI